MASAVTGEADSGHHLQQKGGPVTELETQAVISDEIAAISKAYDAAGTVETQPRTDYPPYRSSLLRHPTKDLHHADPETIELSAPCFGQRDVGPLESDLTIQHGAHSSTPSGSAWCRSLVGRRSRLERYGG